MTRRNRFLMTSFLIIVAAFTLLYVVRAQSPATTKYVSGFSGVTLHDKIVAAQVGCTVMTPCNILIDAFYPRVLGETLPSVCMGCTWNDMRADLVTPILAGDVITQLPNTLNVKDLPNNTTVDILDVDVLNDDSASLILFYFVNIVSDAPSVQNLGGRVILSGINSGGTIQCGADIFDQTELFNSGGISRSWDATPGTGKCTFSIFTKSDISGTIITQRLKYYIVNLSGGPIVRD